MKLDKCRLKTLDLTAETDVDECLAELKRVKSEI